MNHLNCPYCERKAVETFDMHDGTKMYRCWFCGLCAASPRELVERSGVGKVSWLRSASESRDASGRKRGAA